MLAATAMLLALLFTACDTVGPARLYTISGSVAVPDGSRLSGVYVTIGGGISKTVQTDESGYFEFESLPGGLDYVIAASLEGWFFEPAIIEIPNLRFDRQVVISARREAEIVGGVDLTALFAPPSHDEIQRVRLEWQWRHTETSGYDVLYETPVDGGTIRIVGHDVDGLRHVFLVRAPLEGSNMPVIVINHGGDTGIDADEYLAYADQFGDLLDRAVFVMPAFRSESIRIDGRTFTAEGTASTWDRDVDDALAAMRAVQLNVQGVDRGLYATVGFSRGGGVSLLMAARDGGMTAAVSFFGPTDFFDDYVRHVTRTILSSGQFFVPGSRNLNDLILQPLRGGSMTIADARIEMVRRSAALFPDRMPAVQIHHGTHDPVVWVSQAHRFDEAMRSTGRSSPSNDYEIFLYEGAGHNPSELVGSLSRTVNFLMRHLDRFE